MHSTTGAASIMALNIGVAWSASFLCHMYGLTWPLLAHIGNIVGIFSIFILYNDVCIYRRIFEKVQLRKCINLSVLTGFFGCILTSMVQYLYFQFLDNGTMMSSILSVLELPEYAEMLKQMSPEMPSIADMTKMLTSMTVGDLTLQLFIMNLMICIPTCIIMAIFGYAKRLK